MESADKYFITQDERNTIDENIYTYIYKGKITSSSDFPTSAEVKSGWVYYIAGDPSVTDNDPTKTNTGTTWAKDNKIFWTKDSAWELFTSNTLLWETSGGDLQSIIPTDNIDLIDGGLKDSNATTAIKLADSTNTEFETTNKTIVGAINELKNSSNLYQITTSVNNTTKTVDTFQLVNDGACKYDYLINDGSNIRSGSITLIYETPSQSSKLLEYSTNDIGDTSDFVFSTDVNSGYVRLIATCTGNYTVVKINRYSF